MYFALVSFQHLGDASWYILMTAAGVWIAIATPRALRFIDGGFANKSRDNPAAAAKQVKTFKLIGVFFALAGAVLFVIKLLDLDK